MEKYAVPEVEIVRFRESDIITASGQCSNHCASDTGDGGRTQTPIAGGE